MKMRKTTAFYIEALFITLFLLIFSVVLLQMFALAHKTSRQAEDGTNAVIIAQNASQQFSALLSDGLSPKQAAAQMNGTETDSGCEMLYSADGLISENGDYRAVISTVNEKREAGIMYVLGVKVYSIKNDKELLFALETKHFTDSLL